MTLRWLKRVVIGLVHVKHVHDISPILEVWLQGHLVKQGYVDGGVEACVLIEDTVWQLNLKMNLASYLHVKMANSAKVCCPHCLKDLGLHLVGQKAKKNFHVMLAKFGAYLIILD